MGLKSRLPESRAENGAYRAFAVSARYMDEALIEHIGHSVKELLYSVESGTGAEFVQRVYEVERLFVVHISSLYISFFFSPAMAAASLAASVGRMPPSISFLA